MRSFFFAVFLAAPLAGSAAAQPATDVYLPPIEIAAAFSYDIQRVATADLPGGTGTIVAVDGNLDDHLAIATQVSTSPRMRAAMAGGRLSTGYFREGSGVPGRFTLHALTGVYDRPSGAAGAVIQLGAGTDLLVIRQGVSLHWALDYLLTPAARTDFAGARISAGIVIGPRIVKPRRTTGGPRDPENRSQTGTSSPSCPTTGAQVFRTAAAARPRPRTARTDLRGCAR